MNKQNQSRLILTLIVAVSVTALVLLDRRYRSDIKTEEHPQPVGATALSRIESIGASTSDIKTNTDNQVVVIRQDLSGLDFTKLTVTVDGKPAMTLRPFGPLDAVKAYEIRLPRFATDGEKPLVVSYPGLASVDAKIVYSHPGNTFAVFDYSDSAANRGRVVYAMTDENGVAGEVRSLMSANGQDNVGFASGSRHDSFWILGQESTGCIRVFYTRIVPGGSNLINTVDVTDGVATTGQARSIASLHDGSKAVIAWTDPLNSLGEGANMWWLTLLSVNEAGQPAVRKSYPLNKAGKKGMNVTMQPVQVVQHQFDAATGIGGGALQDYAILAQLDAPRKLYLVPLENNPNNDYVRLDLGVKPQVVEVYRDAERKLASLVIVGQNGDGVYAQTCDLLATAPLIVSEPRKLMPNTQDVLAAYVRQATDGEIHLVIVCRGDNAYRIFNLKTGKQVR